MIQSNNTKDKLFRRYTNDRKYGSCMKTRNELHIYFGDKKVIYENITYSRFSPNSKTIGFIDFKKNLNILVLDSLPRINVMQIENVQKFIFYDYGKYIITESGDSFTLWDISNISKNTEHKHSDDEDYFISDDLMSEINNPCSEIEKVFSCNYSKYLFSDNQEILVVVSNETELYGMYVYNFKTSMLHCFQKCHPQMITDISIFKTKIGTHIATVSKNNSENNATYTFKLWGPPPKIQEFVSHETSKVSTIEIQLLISTDINEIEGSGFCWIIDEDKISLNYGKSWIFTRNIF